MGAQAPHSSNNRKRMPSEERYSVSRSSWCNSKCIFDSRSINRDLEAFTIYQEVVKQLKARQQEAEAWLSRICSLKATLAHIYRRIRYRTAVVTNSRLHHRVRFHHLSKWAQFNRIKIATIRLVIKEIHSRFSNISINLGKASKTHQYCNKIKWTSYQDLCLSHHQVPLSITYHFRICLSSSRQTTSLADNQTQIWLHNYPIISLLPRYLCFSINNRVSTNQAPATQAAEGTMEIRSLFHRPSILRWWIIQDSFSNSMLQLSSSSWQLLPKITITMKLWAWIQSMGGTSETEDGVEMHQTPGCLVCMLHRLKLDRISSARLIKILSYWEIALASKEAWCGTVPVTLPPAVLVSTQPASPLISISRTWISMNRFSIWIWVHRTFRICMG